MKVLIILIFLSLIACTETNEKNNTTTPTENLIVNSKEDYNSLNELLKKLPSLSVLTAIKGPDSYLGDFYLDETGIKSTSYAGGGYKSILNSVNIDATTIRVEFSLVDIGNENGSSPSGNVYSYYFEISLEEMKDQMGNDPDGFFMDVEVTELTE